MRLRRGGHDKAPSERWDCQPLVGCEITRVTLDYAQVEMLLAHPGDETHPRVDAVLVLADAFTLTRPDGAHMAVDPDDDPSSLAWMHLFLRSSVTRVELLPDDELVLRTELLSLTAPAVSKWEESWGVDGNEGVASYEPVTRRG